MNGTHIEWIDGVDIKRMRARVKGTHSVWINGENDKRMIVRVIVVKTLMCNYLITNERHPFNPFQAAFFL